MSDFDRRVSGSGRPLAAERGAYSCEHCWAHAAPNASSVQVDADSDEVFVSIPDETYKLWRALDHEDEVLEAYVAKKRDEAAALKFLRRGMIRFGNSEVVVPGKCPS